MVSDHLSCHGIDGVPNALSASKGIILIKFLVVVSSKIQSLPSVFTALVLVINLPIDLPFSIASMKDIFTP